MIFSFTASESYHESWVVFLISFAVSTAFYFLYGSILKLFPEKNLIQICKTVFGKYIGNFLSIVFIILVFFLTEWNICHLCNFFSSFVLLDTPEIILILTFTLTCAYGTSKGIKKISDHALLLFTFVVVTVVSVALLQLGRMDFEKLLPIFSLPPSTYLRVSFSMLCVPLLETAVFMMIAHKSENPKKLPKVFLTAVCVSSVLTLISISSDITILGDAAGYLSIPKYEAVKYITAFDILARTEIVFALFLLITRFFKMEILLISLRDSVAEVFNVKQKNILLHILGVSATAFAVIDAESGIDLNFVGSRVAPFILSFFEIVLPLSIILITFFKRKGESK